MSIELRLAQPLLPGESAGRLASSCLVVLMMSPLLQLQLMLLMKTQHVAADNWPSLQKGKHTNGVRVAKTKQTKKLFQVGVHKLNITEAEADHWMGMLKSFSCLVCHLASTERLCSVENWKTAAGTLDASINIHVLHNPRVTNLTHLIKSIIHRGGGPGRTGKKRNKE